LGNGRSSGDCRASIRQSCQVSRANWLAHAPIGTNDFFPFRKVSYVVYLDPVPTLSESDLEARAGKDPRAYAALTLYRVLAPEWTHVVVKRDEKGRAIGHETVKKPAGVLFGNRAEVEARYLALIAELADDL